MSREPPVRRPESFYARRRATMRRVTEAAQRLHLQLQTPLELDSDAVLARFWMKGRGAGGLADPGHSHMAGILGTHRSVVVRVPFGLKIKEIMRLIQVRATLEAGR